MQTLRRKKSRPVKAQRQPVQVARQPQRDHSRKLSSCFLFLTPVNTSSEMVYAKLRFPPQLPFAFTAPSLPSNYGLTMIQDIIG